MRFQAHIIFAKESLFDFSSEGMTIAQKIHEISEETSKTTSDRGSPLKGALVKNRLIKLTFFG